MMCLECYYETGSEDVMKIDRLIGILSILLQKEKVTAPELAQMFEVSKRTINRETKPARCPLPAHGPLMGREQLLRASQCWSTGSQGQDDYQ